MLIRFKVSNFLSFDDEQELSMIAGAAKRKENHLIYENDLKLLRFSGIYGANASGKSNLLKAVDVSKKIILGGIKANLSNFYCRIKDSNKDKISSFEYEIKINDKLYAYGFDIMLSKNSIQAEWLYELDRKKNKEILIFTRKINEDININNEYFNNDKAILDRINVYYSDMKSQDTVLFLTVMNKNKETLYKDNPNNNVVKFREIFNWFLSTLVIIFPQIGLDNSPFFSSEESIEKINEIISKFGTGIKECKFVGVDFNELRAMIPPEILQNMISTIENAYINNQKNGKSKPLQGSIRVNRELYIIKKKSLNEFKFEKIVLKHKNDDSQYAFSEESDGTQRLFDLIEILMNKKSERVYLIDELDRCLHPELTYKFIDTFLNLKNNNSQLIVTTHESRLLNFDLLRRDEIWFADRPKNGPTNLYSLEKYNERFDKKIDKAYLEGRYGGVPIFETLFPVGDVQDENN